MVESISMRMKACLRDVWKAMKRRKTFESSSLETPLHRCLNVFDLTLLGLGNMTGSGIYVLTGTVIRDRAGPSIFLAYLIAGITAFLNALCYAELGSRIPKAGSAYSYTYIASGEFFAFLIGWSVILEYVLSVASVARGWSATIDAMSQSRISNGTMAVFGKFPEKAEFLGQYPDFLGAGTVIAFGLVLSFGAKLSAHVNSAMTLLNVSVLVLVTILMFALPNPTFHGIAPASHGGFFPYGVGGMIAGAGTCFYAFIGFDAITVSGEEAVDPKSLLLFVPWWTVDRQAAFTAAMRTRHITWATYVAGIGSLLGIGASLFTSLYAMPRIVYAMAADRLLPEWIGYVLPSTKVPIVAMAIFGGLAAILTFLCDIHTLAEFLSIGTLIAFTIVCMNVCILRYCHFDISTADVATPQSKPVSDAKPEEDMYEMNGAELSTQWPVGSVKPEFRRLLTLVPASLPPGRVPTVALVIYVLCALGVAAVVLGGSEYLLACSWWAVLLTLLFALLAIATLFVMIIHVQNTAFDTFKVPFVPAIPCLCIFLNMCLIVKLSPMTWIRFFIWSAIGLVIYFGWGWWHSKEASVSGEFDPLVQSSFDETVNEEQERCSSPTKRHFQKSYLGESLAMEGSDCPVTVQEKTPEQIAEEKLRAKYPNLVAQGPSILQKRLNRNVKYFDSGDYNMAKARCNSSQKAGMLKANPTSSSAIPEVSADVIAAQQTGDTIPTPENVPAVRKKAVELQHELHQHCQLSATATSTTSGAVTTAHPLSSSRGSPTSPVAGSSLTPSNSTVEK
ncbi:Cationic amino acid transporter 4 [Taenia crassiceps]|uniref:Cationic amino acid transporter 4 n=1 Tax=Taenia crassiceps TaxID=6207 RepID=A0ABR4QT32_9CEST